MNNNDNPGIEEGWNLQVTLRAEVGPVGGTSTPDTAYHEINCSKAVYYPETERGSARISLRCDVVRSEPGKDSVGRGFTETLWMGFVNRDATINRLRAGGKFRSDADIINAVDREEGLLKSILIALGHDASQVKAGSIGLSTAAFVGRTAPVFYERSVRMDGLDKNGKPNYSKSYKTWGKKADTESWLSGTKAPAKLFNANKGVGNNNQGSAQVVPAAPLGSMGIPGVGVALGAAPQGAGLQSPQGSTLGAPMANPLGGVQQPNTMMNAGQANAVLGAFSN